MKGNYANVIFCYASGLSDNLFYEEIVHQLKQIKQQQVVYLPAGRAVPLSILTFVPDLRETSVV